MIEPRRKTIIPDESLRLGLEISTVNEVLTTVVAESGLPSDLIWSKTRKLPVILTRQMAIYFLTFNPNISFEQIGRIFEKDHCTVIHSRNAIENWIASNHAMKLRVISISQRIINNH